jgi:hypothetical protein
VFNCKDRNLIYVSEITRFAIFEWQSDATSNALGKRFGLCYDYIELGSIYFDERERHIAWRPARRKTKTDAYLRIETACNKGFFAIQIPT